ncbi:MAG: 50S ribosomal protein L19e [Candidatus Marsarchaeota archaeon]|nr:50S ribosomal protein L19e [Candidatus Marsarchaeota archaeon]
MTTRFVRRIAAQIAGRGENSVRMNPAKMEGINKAMTREDVRKLIHDGSVTFAKEKHNLSALSKRLRKRRAKGRSRGPGRRKGTLKARSGKPWMKRARSQRFLLKKLRGMGKLDRQTFNRYYMLVKGGTYPDKATLLLHLSELGITLTDVERREIAESAKSIYNKRQRS